MTRIIVDSTCDMPRSFIEQYDITHADDMETALYMKSLLEERMPQAEFLIEEIGAVLGVHIGIGGVFFFRHM